WLTITSAPSPPRLKSPLARIVQQETLGTPRPRSSRRCLSRADETGSKPPVLLRQPVPQTSAAAHCSLQHHQSQTTSRPHIRSPHLRFSRRDRPPLRAEMTQSNRVSACQN